MNLEYLAAVADAMMAQLWLEGRPGLNWFGTYVPSSELIIEVAEELLARGIEEWDLIDYFEQYETLEDLIAEVGQERGGFDELYDED